MVRDSAIKKAAIFDQRLFYFERLKTTSFSSF
ncbi:Hypothetical protein Bdt_2314 [Bdellovibrio bacteriovorus str. Tiberius]|uniref:Uncharacterized protein n=1 Tax=Bdellovibrio bacteriovorus str. Tiberius TaxID=1069642 RepID=K7ZFZ7_BDEBC|nr:Hypothetical protein Bdt_2314 [Bdellovibrio bacteriovorus str. Tiberius]